MIANERFSYECDNVNRFPHVEQKNSVLSNSSSDIEGINTDIALTLQLETIGIISN